MQLNQLSERSQIRRTALLFALSLSVVLGLMFYATNCRIAYTMDSLTYRDAALNFLNGYPLQVTNVSTEAPERLTSLQWPPAYPALWAFLALISGLEIDQVPIFLTPVLLGLTTFATFWVVLLLTRRPLIAFVITIAAMLTPSNMAVFGHAWSETLFIPLIILAFGFLWKYRLTEKWFFWMASALCLGIANWTRYTGVIFLPLLAISVYALSRGHRGKRAIHGLLALSITFLITVPLWLHNWNISGKLSGSDRGGITTYPLERLTTDLATAFDLLRYSFFGFDMLIRAHLEMPIAVAVVYLLVRSIRKYGFKELFPITVSLSWVWFGANMFFLLFARITQKNVDMDFRMISIASPFIFLAVTPWVSSALVCRNLDLPKVIVGIMLSMLLFTAIREAIRVSDNYYSHRSPGWRANFGLGYRDLTEASSQTRALVENIAFLAPSTLVLTDYRPLYIRYLTGAKAYALPDQEECKSWLSKHADGVILIGTDVSKNGAQACADTNPRWRLHRVMGRGAPSMSID